MNDKQLLEMLIECVEESKESLIVLTPNNSYYSTEPIEEKYIFVNPHWLINALKARLEKE